MSDPSGGKSARRTTPPADHGGRVRDRRLGLPAAHGLRLVDHPATRSTRATSHEVLSSPDRRGSRAHHEPGAGRHAGGADGRRRVRSGDRRARVSSCCSANRGARLALSILAVPILLTAPLTGGLTGALVVVATLMLWSGPARDWFAGRPVRELRRAATGQAREPGNVGDHDAPGRGPAAPAGPDPGRARRPRRPSDGPTDGPTDEDAPESGPPHPRPSSRPRVPPPSPGPRPGSATRPSAGRPLRRPAATRPGASSGPMAPGQ